MYNYFDIFSLLNKGDIPKAIDTEFESICDEKEYNKNALETRYIMSSNIENREKLRVVHVSVNKSEISNKVQILEGNKSWSNNTNFNKYTKPYRYKIKRKCANC